MTSTETPRLRRHVDDVLAGVARLQRVAARLWERIEDELELSEVQAQALAAVGGGARTVSAVADACGRHVSSASRIVDSLVQRELVTRREDRDDRRAVRLDVTASGERTLATVADLHRDQLERSLARLEDGDASDLARLLSRLADAAEETSVS